MQFAIALPWFSCSSELQRKYQNALETNQVHVCTWKGSICAYPLTSLLTLKSSLAITHKCIYDKCMPPIHHVSSTRLQKHNQSRGTWFRGYGDSCPPKSNSLSAAVQQTLLKCLSAPRCPIGVIQSPNSSAWQSASEDLNIQISTKGAAHRTLTNLNSPTRATLHMYAHGFKAVQECSGSLQPCFALYKYWK